MASDDSGSIPPRFSASPLQVVCVCVGGSHLSVNDGSGTIDVYRHFEQQVAGLFSVTAFC